jgi:ZIP family zinc transporter
VAGGEGQGGAVSGALRALGWGVVASTSLVIGALIVMWRAPGRRLLGLVMGFGGGVLMSAVSFELVDEAVTTAGGSGAVAAGLSIGALVFFVSDTLIARVGGDTAATGDASRARGSSGLTIVLGTALDGIPEAAVLGLTILQTGDVGVSMLVAVFVSNMPESIAASTDLLADGWSKGRVAGLWTGVALVTSLAAMAGYVLLDGASPWTLAFMFAFAGGAILAMLSTSMIPEAYELAGRLVGLAVTAGFIISFAITWVAE